MALPHVQPIRPTGRREPFDNPDWLFDVKYDGFRALCYIEQGRGRFISRNGNAMSRFDAFGDQVAAVLDVDDAIIDGEVIGVDETCRPQFYDLLRGTRAPAYVAFDIAWLNGADLRSLPLSDRRRNLQGILPESASGISEALSVAGKGRELFDLMCAHNLEGIVAKRLGNPYEPWVRWLKIKNPDYSQKEGRGDLFNGPRQRPRKREEPYPGPRLAPPMTLRNAAAARVRFIVWCKDCGHQVEPDPAEQERRDRAETTVPDWRDQLRCSQCGSRKVDMVVTGTERR